MITNIQKEMGSVPLLILLDLLAAFDIIQHVILWRILWVGSKEHCFVVVPLLLGWLAPEGRAWEMLYGPLETPVWGSAEFDFIPMQFKIYMKLLSYPELWSTLSPVCWWHASLLLLYIPNRDGGRYAETVPGHGKGLDESQQIEAQASYPWRSKLVVWGYS